MLTHSVSLVLSSKRQQAAASGSQQQQASPSAINPGQDTDLRSKGKYLRGVESFSSVERSLSKGKRDREFESLQLSQMDKEKILSAQRSLHEYLEKKAERAFKESLQFRREWEMRHADITLYETSRHLESQRTELYQAAQLSDQAQREQSWVREKLDKRKKLVDEDRADDC